MEVEYIAHVKKDEVTGKWAVHDLFGHLNGVAEKAQTFADKFGNSDWAKLVAMWHDLGKFSPDWQKYIRLTTGFDEEAHCEGGSSRPNHSTVGAVLLMERFKGTPFGRLPAYVVAGHHAGLPDWVPEVSGGDLQNRLYDTFSGQLKTGELDLLRNIPAVKSLLEISLPETMPMNVTSREAAQKTAEHLHLWVRMIFSSLVDADFLDTEAFMTPSDSNKRGKYPSLEELKGRFDAYMEEKQSAVSSTPLNTARSEILQQCRQKADLPPGFFSLTVPTGGGKTLSSMAFALSHALKYGKRRVIMAIPYTSIIEQTASVYREVFGEDAVLEHHSNIDPEKESRKSRLASENWDAPVVVTTNVQLFESLLASRTSSCRKLHNIVNSVIILDEAQMLAPEYLKPILSVLQGLVEHFKVSVIMCTATQPALSGRIGSGLAAFNGLPAPKEIVGECQLHAETFKRCDVVFPDVTMSLGWPELAAQLAEYPQVLCVVNTRRDCQELHRLMPKGTVHLSANMCGEERSEVIADIKNRLSNKEPIRVISTQLVEAGVDIDFPVVYRALAGLDSIAQSAGRCNREGRLNIEGRLGRVVVFVPPRPAPVGLLRKGEDATRGLLSEKGGVNLVPEVYRHYFEVFYKSVNDFDKPRFIQRLVSGAGEGSFQFRSFASEVRLIDDRAQRGIVVYYAGKERSSVPLIDQLRRHGPEYWLLRRLQRFIVNVPERVFEKLAGDGHIEDVHGYWVQKSTGLYQPGYGLLPDPAMWREEMFMV